MHEEGSNRCRGNKSYSYKIISQPKNPPLCGGFFCDIRVWRTPCLKTGKNYGIIFAAASYFNIKYYKRGAEMKVLIINGSPRVGGNTSIALEEMRKVFEAEGIETEIFQVGGNDIRGCIACGRCGELGKCVFDDAVNELAPKFEAADGLVVASPVYYASANATLIALLDRLFTAHASTKP